MLYQTEDAPVKTVDILNREAEACLGTDPQQSFEKAKEAEILAKRAGSDGDVAGIARSMVNQARASINLAEYRRAIALASQVLAYPTAILKSRDTRRLAQYVSGVAHEQLGDLPRAQSYYHQFLSSAEQAGDTTHQIYAHNGLGISNAKSKDFLTSITHFLKIRELIETLDVPAPRLELITYHNLGKAYLQNGEPEKGLEFSILAFEYRDPTEHHNNTNIYCTLANTYKELGESEQAQYYYQQALLTLEHVQDDSLIASTNHDYGDFLYGQAQYEESENILKYALERALACGHLETAYEAHRSLSRVAKAKQDFEVALHHHEQFQEIQTQFIGEHNQEQMRYLRVAYEVEVAEKEAEIQRLRTEELEVLVEQRTADVLAALEQSEQANNVRTNMLNTVMHEFRTPLSIIGNSVNMLRRYKAKLTPEKETQLHERITAALKSLSQLLNDVDTVETTTIDTLELTYTSVTIGIWGANLVELLQRIAGGAQNVTYVFDVADATPVHIDTELTSSIAVELLKNALKYTPPDNSITVQLEVTNTHLVLRVVDEGMGIEPENLDKVFKLFFRAYKAGDIPGLGAGLYRVQLMVTALDGEITINSAGAGLGTTVSVKLPLR